MIIAKENAEELAGVDWGAQEKPANPFATREDYEIAKKALQASVGVLTPQQLEIFDRLRTESEFSSNLKDFHPSRFQTMADYGDKYDNWKMSFSGLGTGFPTLDKSYLLGLKPGDIVTVGGQTGVGKSPLAVSLCLQMNAQGKNCLLLGLEDSPDEVGSRVALMRKGLSQRKEKISLVGGGTSYVFTDQDAHILYQRKFALMPILKAFTLLAGVHVVVLDMLNDIIDPIGDKDADPFMVQLKQTVDSLGIVLIMVARLREAKDQIEKVMPNEDSIYGRGMIKYLSTKIITISVDPNHPFQPQSGFSGTSIQPLWVHVVKNRRGYKTSKQRVAVALNFVTADNFMFFEERGSDPIVPISI